MLNKLKFKVVFKTLETFWEVFENIYREYFPKSECCKCMFTSLFPFRSNSALKFCICKTILILSLVYVKIKFEMAFSFGQPAAPAQTSLFGSTLGASQTTGGSFFGGAGTSSAFGTTASATQANPNKDFEVTSPPSDSISGLVFSPPSLQQNFLVSGSWDNVIRCWEVTGSAQTSWQTIPKAEQRHNGAVLDVRFSDVGF